MKTDSLITVLKNRKFVLLPVLILVLLWLGSCKENTPEPTPDLTVTITASDSEAAESATANPGEFTITLSAANSTGQDISIPLTMSGTATNGTDYNSISSVVIPNGQQAVKVALTVIDDSIEEPNETATASIGDLSQVAGVSAGSSAQSADVMIMDNDQPASDLTVSITASDSEAAESATANPGEFTITLSAANSTGQDINIPLTMSGTATNGTDYNSISSAVIPNGQQEVKVALTVIDDSIEEPSETATASIGDLSQVAGVSAGSSAQSADVVILDNDQPASNLTVSITASDGEAAESATANPGEFTVTLSAANSTGQDINIPLTMSGTATNGTDYNSISSAIIPNGQQAVKVALNVIDDSIVEPSETATASIGDLSQVTGVSAGGSAQSADVVILDNDQSSGTLAETIDVVFFTQIKKSMDIYDQNQVWNGYNYSSMPMYYIFKNDGSASTRGFLINPPGTVAGATKLDAASSAGLNVYRYDTPLANVDAVLGGSNGNGLFEFEYNIEGTNYYLQAYNEKMVNDELNNSIQLSTHEAFHVYQNVNWDNNGVQDQQNYPINKDMLALQILTAEIFSKLPAEKDPAVLRKILEMYVAIRAQEIAMDPSSQKLVANMANSQESVEGTARYVEYSSAETVVPNFTSQYVTLFTSGYATASEVREEFAFGLWYGTGAAVTYLMKQLAVPNIETETAAGKFLFDQANAFLNMTAEQQAKALADAKASVDWAAIQTEAQRLAGLN